MTPTRVFLVLWWFDRLGGMERHVTDLAIALTRRGIAVTVFSEHPLARSNQYGQALRAADIAIVAPPPAVKLVERIEHTPLYRRLSRRGRAPQTGKAGKPDQHLTQALLLRALTRHAAAGPPPIIHLHGCRFGQQAVLQWAAAHGCPSVYTEHTTIADWGGPFETTAPRIVGALADALACVSAYSRASMLSYLPEPRDIAVVRHIVAAPTPIAGVPDTRADRPARLLAVGRLAAHKGYATLLAAVAMLKGEGIDLELRIAGEGEQLAELVALRTALALEKYVIFLGRVEQAAIAGLWRHADIGVMPSHSEGLPLSIVEAMAQVKPIVAARVGGIPEVLRDGDNGLLVEPGDAASLADALRRLITDPALARRLAAGARASFAAGGWSAAAVTDHHLALYAGAAQSQAARQAIAAHASRPWIEARMREVAAPVARVVLCVWRMARFGMMEAALCRQALLLARSGVAVTLLVERPVAPLNPYVRALRRAGVRIVAPSPLVSLTHRLAARLTPPGHVTATPLQRAFAAECAARTPDAVHIHGWGLGKGWGSLAPVLRQAGDLGIVSVYSEHAGLADCTIDAQSLPMAGRLTCSSPAVAQALRAAGRAITVTRHDQPEPGATADAPRAPIVLEGSQDCALALAEALADFVPVIIQRPAPGLPVTDRVDCRVAPENPAKALVLLAADPMSARELAAHGRRTYETSGLRDLASLAETITLYDAGQRRSAMTAAAELPNAPPMPRSQPGWQSMPMPAVSVIIPSYNRRRFLPAAIDSVLAQSFRDFEIIVVDDGSSDGTADLLTLDYPEVRLERLPHNHGRSTARNVGWALARGDFVAFLDSDDLWLPAKLSRQIPLFAAPEIMLVHNWVGKVDVAGAPLAAETHALEAEFAIAARRGYGYGGITRTWCRMYTSAVVLRRELLRRTGGFDPKLSNFEDWDMLWRVARTGDIATVPEMLVMHRTHPDNTPTIWAEAATPWLAVNARHLAELAGKASDAEARRGRANLLLNMALGEYWRRDLPASRHWMWRAIGADPHILRQPGHHVWCAPLLHALLPHRLAEHLIARIGPDRYITPEGAA